MVSCLRRDGGAAWDLTSLRPLRVEGWGRVVEVLTTSVGGRVRSCLRGMKTASLRRAVLQGDQVKDQNWEAALFQDLSSSPAAMEASSKRTKEDSPCIPEGSLCNTNN